MTVSFSREGGFVDLRSNRLLFTPGGETLVVSFDNAGAPHREAPDRPAWGHKFFTGEGHAVLGVIAKASDWYRDTMLHDALKELRDRGFFQRFSKVVMTGSSMGGYGATAFSSLVPGCHVISFNPQSTLRSDLVPWDKKHPNALKQDWSGDFSDGAVEAKLAKVCYIFYDPFHTEDARHAKRYFGPGICHLRAPMLGHGLPDAYQKLGILKDVMRKAIDGSLDVSWHSKAIRPRKEVPKYYKALAMALAKTNRCSIGADLMARAHREFNDPYFKYREALFLAGQGEVLEAAKILEKFDRSRRKRKLSKNGTRP